MCVRLAGWFPSHDRVPGSGSLRHDDGPYEPSDSTETGDHLIVEVTVLGSIGGAARMHARSWAVLVREVPGIDLFTDPLRADTIC